MSEAQYAPETLLIVGCDTGSVDLVRVAGTLPNGDVQVYIWSKSTFRWSLVAVACHVHLVKREATHEDLLRFGIPPPVEAHP
jgi:hypothetical protein